MHHRFLTLPFLAGSLLATSAIAFAQSAAPEATAPAQTAPAPDGARHGHHRNRMLAALQQLDLSDDQKAKIKSAMTAFRQSRDTATPETRKELRSQIEQVLTPDQRTQFAAAMKPRREPAATSSSSPS